MSMTYDQQLRVRDAARVIQERYDSAFEPWDRRADAHTIGADFYEYQRDLAVKAKKYLPEDHELRKLQYRRMPNDVFQQFEPQLLKAVRDAAHDPDTVPLGQMRRVVEVDSNTGMKIVKWIGRESFVKDMTRAGRRVLSFRTDQGFFDASGRALR
jgi:hypothetical protein